MSVRHYPEPILEPPEPVIIGYCPVCGGELYEGDTAWHKDGDIVCERHIDRECADWLGWERRSCYDL